MNLREEIVIGFTESINLQYKFDSGDDDFPSLLGGEPVWFNQKQCPENVKCQLCQGDMTFLLQLYTPLEMEHAYHRTIYVFFCKNKACQNKKESFKILRFQQKQSDEITFFKNEKYSKLALDKSYKINTDVVEQKETQMLEKEYMKIAQPFEVDDKEFASNLNKKGQPKENYDKENQLLKQFAQMAMEDPDFGNKFDKMVAESYEDDDDDEDDDFDKCLEKFLFILKKQDHHFLRYCRAKDTTPLWYSEKNQWNNVPKCKNCNKNLIFEFQINSSVLNQFPSMIEYDWGIIVIYTCENSCKSKDISEEHAELQVVLEKEQVEENIRRHMKNSDKYMGKVEEDDDEGEEDGQEEEKKVNEGDKHIKQKVEEKEEEIPCGDNSTQTSTTNETEKPKQKKNKKKKAKEEKQEKQPEQQNGDENEEDW